MKKTFFLFLLFLSIQASAATLTHGNLPNPIPEFIDALKFFVPSSSNAQWIIGGSQTLPLPPPWGTKDPENTSLKTFATTKFNDPRYFEIYKVDANNIYIRYETTPTWIRGFDTKGDKRGEIFVARKIPSLGSKFVRQNFSTHVFLRSNNNWYFSESHPALSDISEYKLYPASDPNDRLAIRTYLKNCNCGLDNLDILLHLSYWQSEGKIVEYYSYGYDVGIVAWRWTENITLNNGKAVQKKSDGSGLYTCYLLNHEITIKNWAAVIGSSTKSVEPEAYISLKSKNDTRVYVSKLNNPNINQSDWYVTCQDNIWNPLTARQGVLGVDLGESSFPLPQGIFALPFEYPANPKISYNKDGRPHTIDWDRAVVISTGSQKMKYVQSYKVVIKQGATIKGTYMVANGNNSFTIPADFARGNYKASIFAAQGYRQDIAATISFAIH